MTAFQGFPKQAFAFLKGLEKNNTKIWFDAHRADYEETILAPAKAFVEELGGRLRTVAPGINAVPQINHSIKRMNRDIRFAKDKSPYKTHLDIKFWEGEEKGCGSSGFFMRMHGDRIYFGSGIHEFPKSGLRAYRDAVSDDVEAERLAKLLGKLAGAGYTVGGKTYKRVPPGFDDQARHAQLLLHGALYVGTTVPVPPEAHTPKFIGYAFGHYKKMAPVHLWLVDALGIGATA